MQLKLERLNLQNNWVKEIQQVSNLNRSCPNLKELNLKGNPVANQRTYRAQVFDILSNLENLDGLSKQKADSDKTMKELDLTMEMIISSV